MPWVKQFDREEALRKAMVAFWANGYDATSMTDLLHAMGIQKGSFYATFGSKRDILVDALKVYVAKGQDELRSLLDSDSPKRSLANHIAKTSDFACGTDKQMGCFLLNIALELAPRDQEIQQIVQAVLAEQERIYAEAIRRSIAQGEIDAKVDPDQTARAILGLILSIRMLGRTSMPAELIGSIRDQALKLIES